MELVAIMDWYSRFVVSWALERSLEATFVLVAVQEAMEKARPEDSTATREVSSPTRIPSGSSRERCKNRRKAKAGPLATFSPHHLRSLKYEEVYLNEYQSPREAR